MKAIRYSRYGGPDVLEYLDLPDPQPGPGEILIAVHAASVAPGDGKVRAGLLRQMFPITLPKIPGRDGAGVVVGLGEGADFARPGDEVIFVTQHVESGGYAELVCRPREAVFPKPAKLSFAQAAAGVHAGVCAWTGLVESAGLKAGQRLLVHGGAGAIGSLAVQLGKHLGAEVIATCRAANTDYVRELGADRVIAYDRQDFVQEAGTCDVVFDLVGGEVHRRSYEVLATGGVLAYLIAKPIEDLSVRYGVSLRRAHIDDRPDIVEAVLALMADGAIVPQVGRVMPLAEAAEAQRMIEAGEHSRGRIVLQVR